MKAFAQWLHRFSGGLLLVGMVIAPWLLGSLPPWAIEWTLGVLAAACGCWVLGLIVERRWPVVNFVSVVGALLLVQGWLMTVHPVARFEPPPVGAIDDMGRFLPLGDSGITGSVDAYSSYLGMRSFTILFLVFHAALDHLRNKKFRQMTLWCAAITGASVAFLGIEQHFGVKFLMDAQPAMEGKTFGPFGDGGNAGSFMLLTLPAAVGLAVAGFLAGRKAFAWVAMGLAAAILGGLVFNTSRAAVAILPLVLLMMGIVTWWMLPARMVIHRQVLLGAMAVAVAAIGLSFFVMPGKWAALPEQFQPHSARRILWGIISDFDRSAGLFGYGPNTSDILWPTSARRHELDGLWTYVAHVPGTRVSIWNRANNDLLQAIVEWGWLGAGLWVMMAAGTFWVGVRHLADRKLPPAVRIVVLGAFAGLVGLALHSFVDSPMEILAIQLYVTVYAAFVWARPVEAGAT